MEDAEDANLLKKVCEGSDREKSKAMARLDKLYRFKLRRYFIRRRQDDAKAEDLCQDVLLKMFLAACSYKGTAALSGWLFRIARNHLVSVIRIEQNLPSETQYQENQTEDGYLDDAADEFTGAIFDPDVDEHEQMRLIEEAMALLQERDPERAETLRLSCVEGWSGAQLAVHLDRTERAAFQYVYESKKKLRSAYKEVKERDSGREASI